MCGLWTWDLLKLCMNRLLRLIHCNFLTRWPKEDVWSSAVYAHKVLSSSGAVLNRWTSVLEPLEWGKQPFQPPLLSWLAWTEPHFHSIFLNSLANSLEVITEQGSTHKSASLFLLPGTKGKPQSVSLRLVPALFCFSLRKGGRIISRIIFNEDWAEDD